MPGNILPPKRNTKKEASRSIPYTAESLRTAPSDLLIHAIRFDAFPDESNTLKKQILVALFHVDRSFPKTHETIQNYMDTNDSKGLLKFLLSNLSKTNTPASFLKANGNKSTPEVIINAYFEESDELLSNSLLRHLVFDEMNDTAIKTFMNQYNRFNINVKMELLGQGNYDCFYF